MFGRNDALPVHGGGGRDNGVSGVPVVNKSVALSLAWVLTSVVIFALGIWHMRANGYRYQLKCTTSGDCTFTFLDKRTQQVMQFRKRDILDAELARLNSSDGTLLDQEEMRRLKNTRSAGYSIRIKARLPVEEGSSMKVEKVLTFSSEDMGRRRARSGASSISKYIHSEDPPTLEEQEEEEKEADKGNSAKRPRSRRSQPKTTGGGTAESLDLQHVRNVTALGLISCFAGVLSIVLAFMFGTWSEKSRRQRLKKAS